MNHVMMAAYVAIVLHFLRKTRRKLYPESRRPLAATTVNPVHVAIPRADLARNPLIIATCINWDVARMLVHELQCRGIPSTISVPYKTDLTPDEIAIMSTCVIVRDNIAIGEIANGKYSDLYRDPPPDFASRVTAATMSTRLEVLSARNAQTASSQKGVAR